MKLVEITKDDFKNFSGIDLEIEFANGNYDSENMPEIFINKVQTSLINTLKANYPYFRNKLALNDDKLENKQEEQAFFEALLFQIEYVLKTRNIDDIDKKCHSTLKGNGLICLYDY